MNNANELPAAERTPLMDKNMGYPEHFDENASHRNFMHVVYQVNNIACLLKRNGDGSISAEYATPLFCEDDGVRQPGRNPSAHGR